VGTAEEVGAIMMNALSRFLHPGAWWIWALCLAAAASRTTNPLLLGLIITAAAIVVAARKPDAPWGKSFAFFIKLGIAIIVIRLVLQVMFVSSYGTHTIVMLPTVALPDWMTGLRLGGPITIESLLTAFYDGLRLATIIICIGAANSLASPTRLLKSVPAVLYEFGVSVVVALTFTPQLMSDIARVQNTRRLRGRTTRGPRAIAGAAMPVFEGALQRSITLAAAMDARGYGRTGERNMKLPAALLLVSLVAASIGVYGFIAAQAPVFMGLPMLAIGLIGCIAALVIASKGSIRTHYRPDPWRKPEWLVAGAGMAVAVAFVATAWLNMPGLVTSTVPPMWPALPLLPLIGIVLAATPALTAPALPTNTPQRILVAA
jgi:energy-coupling factor transport system permease protein